MPKLGVNIDHVATLRQARYARDPASPLREPDLLEAARAALAGGGDSLTVHPRADRRHVQPGDVRLLRARIAAPLNMEMGATAEMAALALELRPAFVCIVPETREEVTTEGGVDVRQSFAVLSDLIPRLRGAGIAVSLFIDPEADAVDASAELGADMVELHTGAFANSLAAPAEVARLAAAAVRARAAGLQVNAGHGLNYRNLAALAAVPHLAELNIGHTIVARAVAVGLRQAVAEMRAAIDAAWPPGAPA
jgi:pyridoxine 5-phosphate synthase